MDVIELRNLTNKHDMTGEDCDACNELLDLCPYHEGWQAGFEAARDFINAAFDDPEQVRLPMPASRVEEET